MKRRAFLGRFAAIAAAVTAAPVIKAEAAPSTGYGPHATWYLEQNRDGTWLIVDQASGDVYTGAPSDEMLDALAAAMGPAPATFETAPADVLPTRLPDQRWTIEPSYMELYEPGLVRQADLERELESTPNAIVPTRGRIVYMSRGVDGRRSDARCANCRHLGNLGCFG